MSEKSKSADAAASRRRWQVMTWLRDLPIWSKLTLIMIVPTVATLLVGANSVADHVSSAGNAERARQLSSVVQASGSLVDGLQNERAAALLLLGYGGEQAERYRENYEVLGRRVDEAKEPYAQRRAELEDLPTNVSALLSEIDRGLADLPALRSQVASGQVRLSEAVQLYDVLINNLLNMRDSVMQLTADFGLSQRIRAAAAISRSKEYLSQKRIVVHRAFIQDELTPLLYNEFIAADQGQSQAMQTFNSVATSSEVELHSQIVSGPDLREAESYSTWVKTSAAVGIQSATFTAATWDSALVRHAQLIGNVEAELDRRVVDRATALRNSVWRQLFIESAILICMLALAIVFTWVLARSMARSLRELREGALAVAQFGLPQAVAKLRDPQVATQLSPAQIADQLAEPLPVRSKDEFGQVAEAFNAVHLEAVRTAAEQAALRASVSTMFVNLARRSQILVDRLIGHLDRLERGEEDPDRLAELFQLDHLATRMRRNDENLLVLAGADSTRVQRQPAALMDVLRAAQSEVEHYTRIEFGAVEQDIKIAAHAVNDMVHLVAELLDNATSFSPPESHVLVEARRVGDRVVLYIEDHGLGISPEQLAELNERLAKPPLVDVAVSRMMGLVVVGRLADRHQVKVVLRPGDRGGTVAEVTLPASVLIPRALPGPSDTRQPAAAQSPFAAPSSFQPESRTAPAAPQPGPAVPQPGQPAHQASAAKLDRRPSTQSVGGRASTSSSTAGLPSWSDLTGANVDSDAVPFAPRPANSEASKPLPQRRPADRTPADSAGTSQSAPNIPRQVPRTSEAPPADATWPPVAPLAPAASSAPAPASQARVAEPTGDDAPPQWPPLSAGASASPTATAAPSTTEPQATPASKPSKPASVTPKPVAAVDLTAELPRVPAPATVPTPRQGESSQVVDETMELPIFRQVESAWFRTRRTVPAGVASSAGSAGDERPSADRSAADAGAGSGVRLKDTSVAAPSDREVAMSAGAAGNGTVSGSGGSGQTDGGGWTGASADGWRTAADEGWRAASAAAEVPVRETTRTGLPKRVPMAQLVPGGVDKPTETVQRRTPEGVRGLLSAYHRGVQRGRASCKEGRSGATSTGQQFSQSRFGTAAGSGQKEQQG